MGIRKGQKRTDNPKNRTFKIRLDDKEYSMMEKAAAREKVSKAEIIRRGIEMQYNKK